jgi:hypothetical protein
MMMVVVVSVIKVTALGEHCIYSILILFLPSYNMAVTHREAWNLKFPTPWV